MWVLGEINCDCVSNTEIAQNWIVHWRVLLFHNKGFSSRDAVSRGSSENNRMLV